MQKRSGPALSHNLSLDTEKQLRATAPPRGLFSGQLQRYA
jgi:hypothetical protein